MCYEVLRGTYHIRITIAVSLSVVHMLTRSTALANL
jgi:hypothetical protein